MKIAIAADKENIYSGVYDNGGEAPYYIIFNSAEEYKIVRNPYVFNGGQAGIDIALILAGEDVDIVAAGSFDDYMIDVFVSNEMDFQEIRHNSIKDAADKFFGRV